MVKPLQVQHIEEAAGLIDPVFRDSPYVEDAALARRVGRDLALKLETLNPIRSFKGRGADYFMHELSAGQQVVCASAGNFGQAIAYAGRARGIPVTVFCARAANPVKVDRMRELGADVVLDGDDFDAAKDAARAYADGGADRLFVEDGHEPRISEGAGTIALELAPMADTLLVPLGNGALIGGVACWAKARAPKTRIVGVCAAGAPSMAESWRRNAPFSTPQARTIADGVAVRVPVPAAVERMRGLVDDVVLVDDDQIREALRAVRDTVGLILEPSGALGVAAALHHRFPSGTLATIVTGSNFSPELLAELR
ncbi:threonine ammonia-lyase [Streptomyces aculeolatus]|uniref:threonine ammonia-lyase n=1 Tax=Streptomyces aculeolatus TaxID=270689 RepID=UPI001CED04D6|nr:pyridoxal-phosphate dependent enzyme [Streptomyces aculeolatus]